MPIYEYECLTCGVNFEKRQSFRDEAKSDCPECDSRETRRLIAAPAIVFKGSGFYINDSRTDKNGVNRTTDKSEKSETKSETKSEGKSEAKPESKATTTSESDKK